MLDIKKISENIKKFRELKGYSREYLSDELEMSISGYSKIERAEIDLTLVKLDRISNILDVKPSQLMALDATNVYNVKDSKLVNNGEYGNIHNYDSENTKKYIKVLELENERLRSIIE